jgi:tRNA threonylcarbamoyladenosine biosynthesis protein TsaB
MSVVPYKLLAFDTSTEVMFIAVTDGRQTLQHTAAGGAQTSAALIPAIMDLLAQANLKLTDLDAIVFGRGPGSFTGLRTACSVAQGLAFGAGGLTVLPLDTLLAVAEEARHTLGDLLGAVHIHAILDARMGEVYSACYGYRDGVWQAQSEIQLVKPDQLVLDAAYAVAGNMPSVTVAALPTATAMLRLAPRMLSAGLGVPADQALPLYIRDKVAQTTAERAALKLTV